MKEYFFELLRNNEKFAFFAEINNNGREHFFNLVACERTIKKLINKVLTNWASHLIKKPYRKKILSIHQTKNMQMHNMNVLVFGQLKSNYGQSCK